MSQREALIYSLQNQIWSNERKLLELRNEVRVEQIALQLVLAILDVFRRKTLDVMPFVLTEARTRMQFKDILFDLFPRMNRDVFTLVNEHFVYCNFYDFIDLANWCCNGNRSTGEFVDLSDVITVLSKVVAPCNRDILRLVDIYNAVHNK